MKTKQKNPQTATVLYVLQQLTTIASSPYSLPPRWQGCEKAAVPSGHLSGLGDPRRDWRRRARAALVSVLPPSRRGQSPAHLSACSPGGQVPAGIGCLHGNHGHGQGVGESGRHPFRCVKQQRVTRAQKLWCFWKMEIAFETLIYKA